MQSYVFLFDEWWYALILIGIMVVSGLIKQYNLFSPFYNFLIDKIKNKKLLVVLMSMFGGVLPIPGRVIISAGLLDTIASKDPAKRTKFGIVDYLATHHYYLWSPLEKTILIPMAVLNLSYFQVLHHTWPLLLVSVLFLFGYIFQLDPNTIVVDTHRTRNKEDIVEDDKRWYQFIDWKLIVFVLGVIIIGNYIKQCHSIISHYIETTARSTDYNHYFTFAIMSAMAFLGSFVLGSSSKFAGMVVLLTNIFGMPYFTYLFALEFAGYLLSPSHKCLAIGMSYFKTPIKKYYAVILLWCAAIVFVGILTLI